jgi:hypothetical protein
MRKWLLSVLFFCNFVFCLAVDFDVVVVGTGPISLFEALYRYHTGNRVLILEAAAECGGAWKAIDICGIPHADMGCHFMGSDKRLLHFLEEYGGCKMVSLDNPQLPFEPSNSPNGYYPAQGCFELIHNLESLIHATNIVLQVNCPLESVYIDPNQQQAIVITKQGQFTTSKIIATSSSSFALNQDSSFSQQGKTKFYHLYLLVEDPTPSRFSYKNININGSSRLMNLSRFVGIEGTGTQLFVFQIYSDPMLHLADSFLEQMKGQGLVDGNARLLKAESYIYEQPHCNNTSSISSSPFFEVLSTGSFSSMSSYVDKWKQVLQPFLNEK